MRKWLGQSALRFPGKGRAESVCSREDRGGTGWLVSGWWAWNMGAVFLFFFNVSVVLSIEPRASSVPGKCSTTKPFIGSFLASALPVSYLLSPIFTFYFKTGSH